MASGGVGFRALGLSADLIPNEADLRSGQAHVVVLGAYQALNPKP